MAYTKELIRKCQRCNTRTATREVFNARNCKLGEYCTSCAGITARRLSAEEAQQSKQEASHG